MPQLRFQIVGFSRLRTGTRTRGAQILATLGRRTSDERMYLIVTCERTASAISLTGPPVVGAASTLPPFLPSHFSWITGKATASLAYSYSFFRLFAFS